jgi:putative nucleotidyltransferase with HDIG domain
MNPKLKQYLNRVRDLPAIPEIAQAVMNALDDPNTSLRDLRKIVERDPAIVVRLLKVANSALYGFSRQIQTLEQAIGLLGMRTVKNLVLAVSLREVFKRYGLMEKLLLEHCSCGGPGAVRLARELGLGVSSDEAFVAGLLHDIGKIALANSDRDEYERIVARTYNEGVSFVEAERNHFGFDHTELGAQVSARWRLPARLETVVRHHHDPYSWPGLSAEERELTMLTALTTACLTKLGVGRQRPIEALELTALPAWQAFDLAPERERGLLAALSEEVKKAEALSSG